MRNNLLIFVFSLYSFYAYSDEDKAIPVVSQYIKNELPAQEACVFYQMYQEDEGFYYMKVRAENRNKSSAGDPNISATLFNLKVSKLSNRFYKVDELGIKTTN